MGTGTQRIRDIAVKMACSLVIGLALYVSQIGV